MEGMNGTQKAITYEEVAAYQADNGVSTYAVPSGGTATGGFVVSWNSDSGFTGEGWDKGNVASPAHGWTDERIAQDASDGNLNTMFAEWATRYPGDNEEAFKIRLNWVTSWMNTYGCVTGA